MNRRTLACRVALTLIILLMFASTGLAQSKGIVVVDRAIIWRSDSSIALAVVNVGTVLELTGQSDRWYEVVVPERLGGRGARGLIAKGQVKLVEGSDPPPARALRGTPPTQPVRPPPPLPQTVGPPVSLRGFGQVGLIAFTARESFEAIFGQAYGPTFGGGVQLQFRAGPYVQGSVERFRKTGQRVFVFEGTTFPLGIPQTVTIQPITVTAGYRFPLGRVVLPYIGGGLGTHRFKEASPYDDAAERVDERHTSYHVHGGVEFRTAVRWVAPAVDVKFTTVPDALGRSGASAEFEEDDLGGWQLQMKVLIGR